MNKSMSQLPMVKVDEIEDSDLLLFWDKSSSPGEQARLIADSSTKVISVGDLKKYINTRYTIPLNHTER